jgi:hypothetical protein
MSMTLSIYNFFSYIFNMDGIDYELEQNELLQEIEKDVLKQQEKKPSESPSESPSGTPSEKSSDYHRKNLELELAFAFSPKPE